MTTKRFLSPRERRERTAALPASRHLAGASAAMTMAGTPLTDDDVAAVQRSISNTTTFAAERDRILTEIRENRACGENMPSRTAAKKYTE